MYFINHISCTIHQFQYIIQLLLLLCACKMITTINSGMLLNKCGNGYLLYMQHSGITEVFIKFLNFKDNFFHFPALGVIQDKTSIHTTFELSSMKH